MEMMIVIVIVIIEMFKSTVVTVTVTIRVQSMHIRPCRFRCYQYTATTITSTEPVVIVSRIRQWFLLHNDQRSQTGSHVLNCSHLHHTKSPTPSWQGACTCLHLGLLALPGIQPWPIGSFWTDLHRTAAAQLHGFDCLPVFGWVSQEVQ